MRDDQAVNGVVSVRSGHSVNETVARLEQALEAKAIKIFAVVDHSGEAEKAGLHMPNTKLVIFGNPKAGTPLMLAAPSVAIDLPLKVLVWEDNEARVWVSYNDSEFLLKRHDLPSPMMATLAGVAAIAAEIAR